MSQMRTVSVVLSLLFSIAIQSTLISQSDILEKDTLPKINWMSFEQALEKTKVEPKKIMLDFYTEWCRWCERMDQTTLKHPAIVAYINENFYPVKFDAERDDIILYKERKYALIKAGKRAYHELAIEMMRGRMSFPSIVFLDESTEVIQCLVGFKTPGQLMQLAKYFAENHYKATPWTAYCRRFQARGVFVDE